MHCVCVCLCVCVCVCILPPCVCVCCWYESGTVKHKPVRGIRPGLLGFFFLPLYVASVLQAHADKQGIARTRAKWTIERQPTKERAKEGKKKKKKDTRTRSAQTSFHSSSLPPPPPPSFQKKNRKTKQTKV